VDIQVHKQDSTIYKDATNLGTAEGMSDKQGGNWESIAMSYLDSHINYICNNLSSLYLKVLLLELLI
jgi:hypothetical protein